MIAIDTHTAVKRLIASGFTEQQSEAIVETSSISEYSKEQDHIKADIVDIKAEIKIMKADIANIKENMATKSDLAKLKSDLILNMVGLVISSTAMTVGLITYFLGK